MEEIANLGVLSLIFDLSFMYFLTRGLSVHCTDASLGLSRVQMPKQSFQHRCQKPNLLESVLKVSSVNKHHTIKEEKRMCE